MLTLGPRPITDPQAVILTSDLIFGSQVTGTAAAHGLRFAQTMTLAAFAERVELSTVQGVILDLAMGLDPELVLKALPADRTFQTLAFGPHVQVAALEAARGAGFAIVLPRSQFSARLPDWLQRVAGGADAAPSVASPGATP